MPVANGPTVIQVQAITGPVAVTGSGVGGSVPVTGTGTFQVTGTVHVDNLSSGSDGLVHETGTANVTGTVHVDNVGFNVNLTASVILPVSQTNPFDGLVHETGTVSVSMSAFPAGTVTVSQTNPFGGLVHETGTVVVAGLLGVTGTVAAGSAPSGNPLQVAGTDGTAVRLFATDPNGFINTRQGALRTYTAVYRLAARPYALSNAFTTNTRKQYATIDHAATATKTVRIRKVSIFIQGSTVATVLAVDLVYLNGTVRPATGNPAITALKHVGSSAAVEATCLALPTTAGTVEALGVFGQTCNLGVLVAATTAGSIPDEIVLFQDEIDGENIEALTIRAGVQEGWAVVLDSTAASTVTATVRITFTEE